MDLLTVAELQQHLKVSKSKIYHLTSRNEIPHYKLNGKVLFRREEIEAWLAQFRVSRS
jgi:excisionase family DNA binding protein